MTSRALTRPAMRFRPNALADAVPSPTPLTCMRLQPRGAGMRPGACHLSTNSRASTQRHRPEPLGAPRCSARRPDGTARSFANTATRRTTPKGSGQGSSRTRRSRQLATLTLIALGAVLFSAATDIGNPFANNTPKGVLNSESFVPFTVTSREQTSPTTFILTVSAPAQHQPANAALVRAAWAHGLWSVEIKQPQLQIARSYTPLPPPVAPGEGEEDDGGHHHRQLRFLVRRYDGGEMSTYLSRLQPGDDVYLRGPHLGFDVAARLGGKGGRVVFLAGGTGVAPALQVARHLLQQRRGEQDEGKLSMEIIWASRSRADCAGCPRLLPPGRDSGRGFWGRLGLAGGPAPPTTTTAGAEDAGGGPEHPVVRELRGLQGAFRSAGHELELRCVADDEAGVVGAADVARAVEGRPHRTPSPRAVGAEPASSSCYYHSQQLLQHSTHESDVRPGGQRGAGEPARGCTCDDGRGVSGKNLLMISGPDGFISAYVGPKVWADGAERQGPVGGLVRKLMQKNPGAWGDWLVLKQ
ncbi:hypothetical protein KVR01_011243 [Diaporthe batatas]|uniref:uncharacterized protein n=1 Tax=Diaporthe batatas TaxID=748121 RepID=UPI001D0454AD|nr:uncharacterized protein KVR01_011243 [Diaporthe batatas]KAG8158800.1 hypothetical protein KVR01_011243 [Diaporthe batatas]